MARLLFPLFLSTLAVPAVLVASPARENDDRATFAAAFFAAERGDRDAEFALGEAYRAGRGVVPDMLVATRWYGRAAEQGHAPAAAELGLLLAARGDAGEAVPWLVFAARRGDPRALCALASLAFNGQGVRRDPALAYVLMTRAAAQGLFEAAERLAILRREVSEQELRAGVELAAASSIDPLERMAAAGVRTPSDVAPTRALRRVEVAPAPALPRRVVPPGRRMAQATNVAQVGAFRTESAAKRAWAMLRVRIGANGALRPRFVATGGLVRVQLVASSRSDAAGLCRAVWATRWACFVRFTAAKGKAPAPGAGARADLAFVTQAGRRG